MDRLCKAFTFAACLMFTPIIFADVTLGVWNIENLSPTVKRGFPELKRTSQHPPRTNEQLEHIADYIEEIGIDGMMLIEVHADQSLATHNSSSQLDFIKDQLGENWSYWIGQSGGKQSIAFLYNTDKIKIKEIQELEVPKLKVQGSDIYDRDPLIAWIQLLENGVEKNDLFVVGLHLKSVQSNVHNHMAASAKLLGVLSDAKGRKNHRLPKLSEEHEVIVMGDLNDSSHKEEGFRYLFDYFEGVGYKHLGDPENYPGTRISGSQIDHILVSKKLKAEVVPGTFKVHSVPTEQVDAYRKTYSDHFPVTVRIKTQNDTD